MLKILFTMQRIQAWLYEIEVRTRIRLGHVRLGRNSFWTLTQQNSITKIMTFASRVICFHLERRKATIEKPIKSIIYLP